MNRIPPMTQERLAELIRRFPTRRIAVIGDFFLDKYLETDPRLAELSVETGRTAHQTVAVRHSPGAAGTVVANLAALGAGRLHALGIIGDDGEGYDLLAGLRRLGCAAEGVVRSPERLTPAYLKPRNALDPTLGGEYERYDTKNRTATPPALGRQVIDALDRLLPELDAVIIADQVEAAECGVITAAMREVLGERARRHPGVIFFADSRRRIGLFRGVIIKPNQFEAVGWDGPPPGAAVELGRLLEALPELRRRTGAPVVITRGGEGMLVSDPEPTAVPGVRVPEPLDTTGAGDSATAGTVLALAAGATLPEAALIGGLVASITIQQLATTGVARPGELPARLALWRAQNQ
jgi:bifunctional ADP-heptose synthase (sugar kinase/adenylyltransferase)